MTTNFNVGCDFFNYRNLCNQLFFLKQLTALNKTLKILGGKFFIIDIIQLLFYML